MLSFELEVFEELVMQPICMVPVSKSEYLSGSDFELESVIIIDSNIKLPY